MNSIISLLWQFEIPGHPIVVTALKNQQQTPHHYFYSAKQNRVLRKKNPNVFVLIEQSQTPKNQKPISKLLKISRNEKLKTISLQFCEGVIATSELSDQKFEGQYAIIEPNYELLRIKFEQKAKQPLWQIQYLTSEPPIKSIEHQIKKYLQNFKNSIISGMNKKIKQLKPQNSNVETSKITYLQLILAASFFSFQPTQKIFFIVEAMSLKFSKKTENAYQITYKPQQTKSLYSTPKAVHKKQIAPKQQIPILDQKYKYKPQIKIENQIQKSSFKVSQIKLDVNQEAKGKVVECQCCSAEIFEQNCKQILNEDFISLRKLNKLSIRGFSQEYYQVCLDCYMKL